MKNVNKILLFLILFLGLLSCSERKTIIITKEYIQNDYWNEKGRRTFDGIPVNEIQILKLKLRDSVATDSLKNYSLKDYVNKGLLEIDTIDKEQNYRAFIPKTEGIKIYFNKNYDKWLWFCYKKNKFLDNNCTKRNIGELKNNTWYLFSNGIRSNAAYDNGYLVYIYVDENGQTHMFIRNLVKEF